MDEVTVSDKTYISSKRAAEICAYSQDYIGQLARGGLIDAQRIGGLWYVLLESVQAYKVKAESYKPEPPKYNPGAQVDSSLTFDGKEYVSAARAAKVSQYNQDYVGQLARAGRISSRLVGNRWYVATDELIAHKQEKDALLAAVQAEAVGLKRAPEPIIERPQIQEEEIMNYSADNRDLMPQIGPEPSTVGKSTEAEAQLTPATPEVSEPESTFKVPIRVINHRESHKKNIQKKVPAEYGYSNSASRNTIFKGKYLATAFTVVIVIGISVATVNSGVLYTFKTGSGSNESSTAASATAATKLGDSLERILTKELVYIRD